MHPRYLRDLVGRGDPEPQIFVAMSFHPCFAGRFADVIQPAIESLAIRDKSLRVHRVDRTMISDSIVAEIVEGISRDLLIFADISTLGVLDNRPMRNENVLYELGLAHAIRRPEDVVIFRSDDDALLFDVSGIRVHSYSPDEDVAVARDRVAAALKDALKYGAIADQWTLDRAVEGLDSLGLGLLLRIGGMRAMADVFDDMKVAARDARLIPSLHRLLQLGLVRMKLEMAMTPANPRAASLDDLLSYDTTWLGREVIHEVLDKTGVFETFASKSPEIAKQRTVWLQERSRARLL